MILNENPDMEGLEPFRPSGQAETPPLNGLVLTGGKSVRMGRAKEQLDYHGKEQRYFVAGLLQAFCDRVFISCRPDQVDSIDPAYGYAALPDSFLGMGPAGGILSAFRSESNKEQKHAWLVVACDLPLLTTDTLRYLTGHRNPSGIATAFKSAGDGLPEPLMTIWEPCSYGVLLNRLVTGSTCPRKALIQSNVPLLELVDKDALMNVNTLDEAARVQDLIQKNNRFLSSFI